jgi:hypothetical protein
LVSLRCLIGLHDMGEWVRDGYIYRSRCSRCPHEHIKMVPRKIIEAELLVKVVKHLGEYLIKEAMIQQNRKKRLEDKRIDWR